MVEAPGPAPLPRDRAPGLPRARRRWPTPLVVRAGRRAAPTGRVGRALAHATLFASVAGFHVVDHRFVPPRWHPVTHLTAGASAVVAAAVLGASRHDLGLDPDRLGAGVRLGLAAGATGALVVGAASFVGPLESVLEDPRAESLSATQLARRAAIEITIGTAVYEELVFRSALLALAIERFPEPVALAGTSALFGLWHVLPAIEDRRHNPVAQRLPAVATIAPTVAVTALAGLWFTGLRRRSGHVVAPIIAHAFFNTASLLAASAVHARVAARASAADAHAPADLASACAGPDRALIDDPVDDPPTGPR